MNKNNIEKLIEQIRKYIFLLNDHTNKGNRNVRIIISCLNDINKELFKLNKEEKPSLEDYIQALPYLMPDETGFKISNDSLSCIPELYKFKGSWYINWVDDYNFAVKNINGNTPTEAAKKAYEWCVKKGFIKDTLH